MTLRIETSRIAIIAAMAAFSVPAVAQTNHVIPNGTTDTAQKTVAGTDTVTVQAGGTLATTTNPAINWNDASTGLVIDNSGTIRTTNISGRAINASGGNNARSIILTNRAGGLIESADDAFRINVDPTAGTIIVNNAGIIRTTSAGQALDFDAIATGGASVTINNLAGGELRSTGQDAIRPGQGAVVTNAGLIRSDGAPNSSFDGVDWQLRSGVVINQTDGTISGLRHGITSDTRVDVTNEAGAAIIGRNGSGVGSDGDGIVVNRGTITGSWDGVATNGDGDGVDIDLVGTVRNYGTIRGISATGVDSGGRPNSAQGIAMGGGVIENAAGALISGGRSGILIDDGADNTAYGATTITNAGTIEGLAGAAIALVGNFNDSITNSGTIRGVGTAIQMGGGDDVLTLLPGSVITGTVDGGAGTDRVTLAGSGNGSFAGSVNFEQLAVDSGSWTLTSNSSFTQSTIAAGATLTGTTAVLTGGVANAGILKIDQAFSGTLAAVLSGAGTLQKLGTGTLDIGTLGGFNGSIQVQGGRLNMLGASASAVTVGSGATLGGTGSVGSVTVQSGGTISPGTSIGTLTVTGNLTQATGSTYAAEIAVGSNDRIAVGGSAAIQTGTTLAVTRAAGTYAIGSRYTLLTATGGVNGNYGSLTQNALGDTELRLGATSNSIFVDVARTGASLVKLGGTPNQIAVATAFGTLNAGNAAYAVLTLNPDDAALRAAFNLLSGEIHASIGTAMVQNAISAQSAIASRFGLDAEGTSIWGQFVGATGEDEGVFASGDADSDTIGGMGGVDLGRGEARIGLAGGYTRDKLRVSDRLSSATLKTAHLLAYAGGRFGGVSLRGEIGYGWTSVDTRRSIVFTGFSDQTAASYDGSTLHGFAELGIPVPLKDATIEPFAGVAGYRVKTDAFAETGGAAMLRGAGRSDTFALGKLGLRATLPITGNVSGGGSIAWQHMFGELRSFGRFGFGAAPATFDIAGTTLSRNAAAAAITLSWHVGGGTTLSFGYDGLIGQYGSRSNGRISLSVVF
jgi:outer membrane autotransporter protein